jgi:prevent-host-death family protein
MAKAPAKFDLALSLSSARVYPKLGHVKRIGLARESELKFGGMQTVALEKAKATLADLLKQVADGEEFTITQDGQPKAKLSAVASHRRAQARAGSLGGTIWLSPDFDAPLDDFKDYMK